MSKKKWLYLALPLVLLGAVACSSSKSSSAAGGSGSSGATSSGSTDPTSCQRPSEADLTPAFKATWDALISKAKKEGTLQIVTGTNVQAGEQKIWQCFGKKYGIKVVVSSGNSSEVNSRIEAERSQGRYTVDIAMLGGAGMDTFVKDNAFAPIAPQIIYPDVLDRTNSFVNKLPYFDTQGKYVTLYMTILDPNVLNVYYNTQKVSKSEIDSIQSFNDLLDPKWKGKIILGDVAAGEDDTQAAQGWLTLGQSYYDKLVRTQDPKIEPLGGARQFTDAIVDGQADFGLFPGSATSDIATAEKQGLPIAELTRTLKEGAYANLSGQIGIMDRAPDAAAAQLFTNWLLSKDGQTVYNAMVDTTVRADSLSFRKDVPQGNIKDADWNALHAPGFKIDYDPAAFDKARKDADAFFKNLFTELKINP
jgi:iron(III) transport system substrate-binding protein